MSTTRTRTRAVMVGGVLLGSGHVRAAINRLVQNGLRRVGYELHPYDPDPAPAAEDIQRAKLLASERVDVLLDVGANEGQYAVRMRRAGFDGRIASFEPLADAF